jgi:hypothetical protein
MTTYHDAPFTVEPWQEIPADAPLSAAMQQQDLDALAAASAAYAPDDTVDVQVASSAPWQADVTLSPATPFITGYRVQWNFGDGQPELDADDLDQHHTYDSIAGAYRITAYVQQPERATFALDTGVAFDDAGVLTDPVPTP